MRITLFILIGIHATIHLLGFLESFNVSNFNVSQQPIPKIEGILWLLTFLLFSITAILYFVNYRFWWLFGFFSVIISQILILNHWSEAKFGSIINLFILLATIIGYSSFNFKEKIKNERKTLFNNSQPKSQEIITKNTINHLPSIVQKWLVNSEIIGKQQVSNIYLIQELQLKLKPEQKKWNKGKAEQYFTVNPPAFNWNINTKTASVFDLEGRDRFEDGKGEMIIKLLSIIPVADAKNSEKVNQATLQRYLAEIIWFPSGSLSQYIKWKSIDNYSVKATMEYGKTKGSGEFHFDKNGNFKKFVTLRYKEKNDTKPNKWVVTATKIGNVNGTKIPVECEVSWELEGEKFTWLKVKIVDVQYNLKEMPVINDDYK